MIKRTVRNKYKRFAKQVDSLTVLIHTRSHPMPIIDLYKKVYNPYTYIYIYTHTHTHTKHTTKPLLPPTLLPLDHSNRLHFFALISIDAESFDRFNLSFRTTNI